MTTWTIKLVNGSEYNFIDLHQALGQYYEFQSGWIKKLQSCIKEQSTYSVHINLLEITTGPKNEKLLAPFLLLLITNTKLTVAFLGELTENETGYIVGIWPDKFLQILKSDNDAILNILFIITDQPELVEKLDLYF